jgi:hypothetical protein
MPRKAAQPKAKLAPAKKGLAKPKKPVGAPKMTNPQKQCKDSHPSRKHRRLVHGRLRRCNSPSIAFSIIGLAFHPPLIITSCNSPAISVGINDNSAFHSVFPPISGISFGTCHFIWYFKPDVMNLGIIPPSGARKKPGAVGSRQKVKLAPVQKADPDSAQKVTVSVELVGDRFGT